MRQIKFRVWDGKSKSWLHGPNKRNDLDGINILGENILFGNFLNGVSIEDLDKITVLQFTGLQDEDGKDIYEGDLMRVGYSEGHERDGSYDWYGLFEVKFEAGSWSLVPSPKDKEEGDHYLYMSDYMKKKIFSFRVEGNIFENPDLLCD